MTGTDTTYVIVYEMSSESYFDNFSKRLRLNISLLVNMLSVHHLVKNTCRSPDTMYQNNTILVWVKFLNSGLACPPHWSYHCVMLGRRDESEARRARLSGGGGGGVLLFLLYSVPGLVICKSLVFDLVHMLHSTWILTSVVHFMFTFIRPKKKMFPVTWPTQ